MLRGMWDLPRPGLEPVSPALAGGFLTTAPPGKPHSILVARKLSVTVRVTSEGLWRQLKEVPTSHSWDNLNINKNNCIGEFPGGPVIRTASFHCWAQVQSLVRELRSRKPHSAAPPQKNCSGSKHIDYV